jgi:hypothetical protein
MLPLPPPLNDATTERIGKRGSARNAADNGCVNA